MTSIAIRFDYWFNMERLFFFKFMKFTSNCSNTQPCISLKINKYLSWWWWWYLGIYAQILKVQNKNWKKYLFRNSFFLQPSFHILTLKMIPKIPVRINIQTYRLLLWLLLYMTSSTSSVILLFNNFYSKVFIFYKNPVYLTLHLRNIYT
jgi:hypothetical protein